MVVAAPYAVRSSVECAVYAGRRTSSGPRGKVMSALSQEGRNDAVSMVQRLDLGCVDASLALPPIKAESPMPPVP
jgi:hypothetical protein